MIEIRERTPDDDATIVRIRNESQSHLPPMSVERYRFQARPDLLPEGGISERFVAVENGQIVGVCTLFGNWFYERPNTLNGSIVVDVNHRGKGIGQQMFDHLMARAAGHGVQRMYGFLTEGDERSAAFAEKRGFKPDGRVGRLSRLDVNEADFEGYEDLDERLEGAEIEIKTLAEVDLTDDFLHKLHDATHAMEQDIPSAETWAQGPFESFKEWMLRSPGSSPAHQWVALNDGEPVAYAGLSRHGEDSAFNGLTGTLREFRGNGVARAMKRKQIEWARENGVRYIFTSNDIDNKRMLAINVRLGYKPVPNEIEIVRDFD
jgi:GNAT superfamily N-acetyltransferase